MTRPGTADPARPLRVLIVSHYFPPEVGAAQARLSETAKAWAAAGLAVTVLTGMPNHPSGIVPTMYRGAVRRVEQVDGYRVVRTWLYATPNEGIVRTTLCHLSFMVSAVVLGWRRVGRPDVVVVSSPTFCSLGAAVVLARAAGARLVVEVRDLWPAISVEPGALTNRRMVSLLERLALAAYRAADAVVTVTEAVRDNLARRGVPPSKIHVIRDGVDLDRFARAGEPDPAVRARLGARPGDTLVLYLGTHGISQGLTSVAEAARRLTLDSVHIAFVGAGADRQRLARTVAEWGLVNVAMLPAVPRDEVPAIIAAADICVVPLRDVPVFSTSVPSKIFEFLATGRPVIGAVRGEAATILLEAGAHVVPPERPDALAEAVRALASDPARRSAMADAGRSYVATHFDRRVLARRYRALLQALNAPPTVPPPRESAAGEPARDQAVPTTSVPNSSVPNSSVPNSSVPSGSVPSGSAAGAETDA
jgi:hypothetical protein